MTGTPSPTRTDAPQSSAVSLALLVLALVVAPWVVDLRSPRLPTAQELAGQVLVDPVAVERLQVHYLTTSWQDSEGTWQTLDGLAEVARQAQAPGPAGDAARLALGRLDAALRLAAVQDPMRAQEAAELIAAVSPGGAPR